MFCRNLDHHQMSHLLTTSSRPSLGGARKLVTKILDIIPSLHHWSVWGPYPSWSCTLQPFLIILPLTTLACKPTKRLGPWVLATHSCLSAQMWGKMERGFESYQWSNIKNGVRLYYNSTSPEVLLEVTASMIPWHFLAFFCSLDICSKHFFISAY